MICNDYNGADPGELLQDSEVEGEQGMPAQQAHAPPRDRPCQWMPIMISGLCNNHNNIYITNGIHDIKLDDDVTNHEYDACNDTHSHARIGRSRPIYVNFIWR